MHVALVRAGAGRCDWDLGSIFDLDDIRPDSSLVGEVDAVFLWNPSLGQPDARRVHSLLEGRGDLWHAGLALGTSGQPLALDTVRPGWMLGLDPPSDIEATSWRASADCCLVRGRLWHHLGGLSAGFEHPTAATLDLGLRAIANGAICRHRPDLVRTRNDHTRCRIPLTDEMLIVARACGRRWLRWALAAGVAERRCSPIAARHLWQRIDTDLVETAPYAAEPARDRRPDPSVAVVIPTLNRATSLARLLPQIASQTHAPDEVHIVDQSAGDQRRDWASEFASLPIRVHRPDRRGQSTARNLALLGAEAEAFWFLDDDDDELQPDLLASHLSSLRRFNADACSGVALEPGEEEPPVGFDRQRISDVFPTNNTVVRRSALLGSGLFDPAFDRGARADHDLGLRLYRSGALMLLDPVLRVLHNRTLAGGLRTWGARRKTYRGSRENLFEFHLPSVTELYLEHRYLSSRQRRWSRRLALTATGVVRGGKWRRLVRLILGTIALPVSWLRLMWRDRLASRLLQNRQSIPKLGLPVDPG